MARHTNGQTKDKTGQKGGSNGRKQPSCTQRGKTAGQEREKEERKKEKGVDEAGKSSTELYQGFITGPLYFLGLR